MTTLVLFDIDGTLLWTDGAGRRAIHAALVEIFGASGPADYWFDGKTDRQIVRDLMRHAGHGDTHIDARMDSLLAAYAGRLRHELRASAQPPVPLPGVLPLLDALEARPNVVLGLLTGNIAEGATAKLEAVGIAPSRFRVAAYGSDRESRPELPAVALQRARELLGVDVAPGAAVVIGDTPADIDCGRRAGTRTVAVATGRYTVEQLAEHDADAVFGDLRDTGAVLRAILDARP
ncbi:MAG TPA: HAD family hydrolase [Gemmatimonadaceae bacterium]|nr:HAD family hydrolase [Gemmatimonadaceae bacterium]